MKYADKQCLRWAESILQEKGLQEWKIDFSPNNKGFGDEGLCLQDSKRIIIHWQEGKPNYPLMLHEITHIITGSGHDSIFAHEYMKLVSEYFIVE